MKKEILIVFGITILILCISFSGCNEESSSKKPVSQLMDNFAITLDDLPYGYYKINEDFNDTLYTASFVYQSLPLFGNDIGYPFVMLSIIKFNSINDSIIYYQYTTQLNITGVNITTLQDIERIGDESKFQLYQGEPEHHSIENRSNYQLKIRIKNFFVAFNIWGYTDTEIDYISFTINLAKIVEDRIYTNLE